VSADLLDRLRLIRTPGIGPIAFRQLLMRFGTARDALAAIPDLARRGRGSAPKLCSVDAAEREIAAVERLGARFLSIGQGLYPRALSELENAPPLITAKGRLELLDRPMVAIVGARNASAAACRFARGLAHELGREGVTVVSGLARGIDTAAHDGSIDEGTIAVIAGGIDVVYPPENAARQRDIAERGLVLAEMAPGTEPRARHFPYRNRIIAGLSAGTVVVEAAPRSGSLITARLAAEVGREVMAVLGSPLDPRAQGCNGLIRDGATLIQNAADVIEAVRPTLGQLASPRASFEPAPEPIDPDPDLRSEIESLLGPSPVLVDEIVRQSGAPAGAVQLVLLELDLAGRLDRHAGGKVSLNPGDHG
jgi:DNA processing protein